MRTCGFWWWNVMNGRVRYIGVMPRVHKGGVHQQDYVQDARHISGAIVSSTHGSGAHFTKTMIVYETSEGDRKGADKG